MARGKDKNEGFLFWFALILSIIGLLALIVLALRAVGVL